MYICSVTIQKPLTFRALLSSESEYKKVVPYLRTCCVSGRRKIRLKAAHLRLSPPKKGLLLLCLLFGRIPRGSRYPCYARRHKWASPPPPPPRRRCFAQFSSWRRSVLEGAFLHTIYSRTKQVLVCLLFCLARFIVAAKSNEERDLVCNLDKHDLK